MSPPRDNMFMNNIISVSILRSIIKAFESIIFEHNTPRPSLKPEVASTRHAKSERLGHLQRQLTLFHVTMIAVQAFNFNFCLASIMTLCCDLCMAIGIQGLRI